MLDGAILTDRFVPCGPTEAQLLSIRDMIHARMDVSAVSTCPTKELLVHSELRAMMHPAGHTAALRAHDRRLLCWPVTTFLVPCLDETVFTDA